MEASKKKPIWIIVIIIMIVTSIIITSYFVVIKTNYISMNELKQDFIIYDEGGGYSVSYEDGDIVKIKDTIIDIELAQPSENQTYVWFESIENKEIGWALVFYENITDEFNIGDEVIVTLRISEWEMDGVTYEAWPKLYAEDIRHS